MDTVLQPHVWEPHHRQASARDEGVTVTMLREEMAPALRQGLAALPKGNTPGKPICLPRETSPNTLQRTYNKGGQQTLKKENPSSYFGNSQSYSAKKSSYLHIFLSGSTTDRTGQVLLIKTQIFFSSGYQSTIPC